MKSLKRTLSLVLALVMVLGLFGGISMTAAASDFTDDKDIQYKEAVDVMTAIGAIEGYEEGDSFSFKPNNTITRAEAAKLVAYTVLGPNTAKQLKNVKSSFSDVTVEGGYDWAIPSIEYLVGQKVINGLGDGTFNPKGNITGYEIGKMLLCALGYGVRGEYVGDGWDLNVAIDGVQKGVFSDRVNGNADLGVAATREEVALYCFNTIQEPMVEYLSALDIYNKIPGTVGTDRGLTIIDTVYAPHLELETDARTVLQEPANEWFFKGQSVGIYEHPVDVTYTSLKTAADKTAMNKEFRSVNDQPADVEVAKNGYEDIKNGILKKGENGSDVVDLLLDNGLTGNGTTVKVYFDIKGDVANIVQIRREVAKVSFIDPSTGDVTIEVTSANQNHFSKNGSYKIEKTSSLYESVAGLALDDRVIIVPFTTDGGATYSLYSVTPTKRIDGEVDSSTVSGTVATSYTVDGDKYAVAACATQAALTGPDQDAGASIVDTVEKGTVWLDSDGYVADYEPAESVIPSRVFMLLDQYTSLSNNRLVDMATLAKTDGTVIDVPFTIDPASHASSLTNGTIVIAETKSMASGTYKLSPLAPSDATSKGELAEADSSIALNGVINASDRTLTETNTKDSNGDYFINYYADGTNVKFIYYKEVSTGSGIYGITTVREGVQKASKIDGTSTGCYAVVENRGAVTDDTVTSPIKANVVTAVFLPYDKLEGVVDTSNILMAISANPVGTDGRLNTATEKNETINRYAFYANGEKVEYNIKGDVIPATGGFYAISPDPNVEKTYNLTQFTTSGYNQAIENGTVVNGQDNVIKVEKSGDTSVIDISKANIVDVRSSKNPVLSTTPQGIVNHIRQGGTINASVLYDSSTGYASAVYILSVSGGDAARVPLTVTMSPKTGKVTGSDTYEVVVAEKKVSAGDTVTIYVKTTALDVAKGKDTITISATGMADQAITVVEGNEAFYSANSNVITIDRSGDNRPAKDAIATFQMEIGAITGTSVDLTARIAHTS